MFNILVYIFLIFSFIAIEVENAGNLQVTTYDGLQDKCGGSNIDADPFVKIGSKYYYIESVTPATWFTAAYICRRHNAHLANIENEQELTALSDYIIAHGHRVIWYWISGNDIDEEGKFFSIANGKPISYTKWTPNQPDNANGDEDCMQLLIHGDSFHMKDQRCNKYIHFICQAEEPRTVVLTVW